MIFGKKKFYAGLLLLLFCLFFCFFLWSCSFFSDYVSLNVVFPAELSSWEESGGIDFYLLVYPDPADNETMMTKEIGPDARASEIRIRKGAAVPVALYPNGNLKPVGGVFPLDLADGSTLRLSKEEGFLADILLSLQAYSSRIEGINIPRLQHEIMETCGGNPWSINSETLKTAIILGSISVYKIKREEYLPVILQNLPGEWISDNPFSEKEESDSDGTLYLNVYPGIQSFFNPGTGSRLYLDVHDDRFTFIVEKE